MWGAAARPGDELVDVVDDHDQVVATVPGPVRHGGRTSAFAGRIERDV